MSRGSRTFLIVFGLAVLLLSATIAAVAVSVQRCGMLSVDVRDFSHGGQRVAFKLPGAIVPIAVQFVPDKVFGEIPREVHEHISMLRVACDELAKQPDFVMVEVHDGNEHVFIAKRGRDLVIDVESHDEEVHITVPLSLMKSVVGRLARLESCDLGRGDICRRHKRVVVGS